MLLASDVYNTPIYRNEMPDTFNFKPLLLMAKACILSLFLLPMILPLSFLLVVSRHNGIVFVMTCSPIRWTLHPLAVFLIAALRFLQALYLYVPHFAFWVPVACTYTTFDNPKRKNSLFYLVGYNQDWKKKQIFLKTGRGLSITDHNWALKSKSDKLEWTKHWVMTTNTVVWKISRRKLFIPLLKTCLWQVSSVNITQ